MVHFRFARCLSIRVLLMSIFLLSWHSISVAAEMTFEIRGYEIVQNDRIPDGDIQELLWPYIGYAKSTEEIEQARAEVEKYFQQQGFIRTMVSIPQQTLDSGIVRLDVVETKIARVKVTGNRFYTKEMLLHELPSIAPGQVMQVSRVKEDFGRLARNPNLKVKLGLVPSRKNGEDTIELKVEDQLPLHGKVELNNRSSHDTSSLRLSAMVRYDNLWQKNHSASLQAQVSPENTDEVRVISGSYVMPRALDPSQLLVFYAVWSDSQTATGGDINVIGKGNIYGARYVRPLTGYKDYAHNLTFGIDYKNFDETIDFSAGSDDPIITPVSYVPVSLNYGASLKDKSGITLLSAGLSGTIRGLGSQQDEFAEKNYKSRGNYLILNTSLERKQPLPQGFQINLKIKEQWASEPLIANEQFIAGGMDSVHGYKESEASGDNAFYASSELVGPELVTLLDQKRPYSTVPALIYEYAKLQLKEPLAGQDKRVELNGLGLMVKGQFRENLKYRLDWGLALSDTGKTDSGTQHVYFNLAYEF